MLRPLGSDLLCFNKSHSSNRGRACIPRTQSRCSASLPGPRRRRETHGPVTHVTTQAAQPHTSPPAPGSGVRTRLLRNRKGVWQIRHIAADDLLDVADLQASSFHESLPVDVFDKLAFTMFKAEVLDALKKKLPVVEPDSFAMLVVEELQRISTGSTSGSGSSIDCSDSDSDWDCRSCDWDGDAAAWLSDQQAAAAPAGSAASAAALDASIGIGSGGGRRGRIIGVVEVGLQDEADVLQHLPANTGTYAYISSMAVAAHARRAGIGCALLQAAEQQAALWQKQLISLHVYDTNAAAINLYEKYGLRVLATDSQMKRLLGGKVRHLMTKQIGADSSNSSN